MYLITVLLLKVKYRISIELNRLTGEQEFFNKNVKSDVQIVVVDDEYDVRNSLGLVFSHHKLKTHTTSCIKDTLNLLNRIWRPNMKFVMLVDYRLDGENGVELCQELSYRNIDCVCILISAFDDVSIEEHLKTFDRRNTKRCGCNCVDEIVKKPIMPSRLLEIVEKYL